MSFKLFIVNENLKDKYAWMSPEGEVIPIPEFMNHVSAIKTIAGFTNITDAWQYGWMRINYIGDTLYVSNHYIKPNYKQLEKLKKIVSNLNFSSLIFDSGDDEHILWKLNKSNKLKYNNDDATRIASKNIRDLEVSKMHPYYKSFGD